MSVGLKDNLTLIKLFMYYGLHPNLNKFHKMFHLSHDLLLLPLMLLILDILTVMLKTHVSTSFLLQVIGLAVWFGSAFPDLNTEKSLGANYSKPLQFAQNTLAWDHSLTCTWVCTFLSYRNNCPSHSHPYCFSSSGTAEMEGLEIFSTSPPAYSHSTSFHLVLKEKGKVSRKRKQLPKEDICVNKEKSLLVFNHQFWLKYVSGEVHLPNIKSATLIF